MSINDFLSLEGLDFVLVRNNQETRIRGLFEPDSDINSKYISFSPDADVQIGDILIHPSKKRYPVIDTEIEYFSKSPYALKAYYEKASTQCPPTTQTFNIGSVHGSFVGNASNSSISYVPSFSELRNSIDDSDSQDKKQLHQLLDYLESMTTNEKTIKRGCLSKFSSLLQRNSWITEPLSAAIFSWLTAQL